MLRESSYRAARLDVDFKAMSSRSMMERWIADGRLPVVRASVTQYTGNGVIGTMVIYHIRLGVLGTLPALAVSARVNDQVVQCPDLAPGIAHAVRLSETIPDSGILSASFSVLHSTAFGAIIEDVFELHHVTKPIESVTIQHRKKRLISALAFEVE